LIFCHLALTPSETIGALSHQPIVLTDTIDYRTFTQSP